MPVFGGGGVGITMKGAPTNFISLPAGGTFYPNSYPNPSVPGQGVGNAGWFYVKLGRYSVAQILDPVSGVWRGIGDDSNAERYLYGDGVNMRIANQSGCAVGAVVTTAGSGYTAAPSVTASAGSSVWKAVLGPYVSSATVTYSGSNYTYPPICVIDAPPAGGVQATATAALTSGTVSSITIVNQGAGYSAGTPNIRLINDTRDLTGSGALGTLTLAGSQTVAAVLCVDHGNPITSGTIPTLTFGSGSAAATVLMNWGIQTYAAGTAGAGYGASLNVEISGAEAAVPVPVRTNPTFEDFLVRRRKALIWAPTNSSGGITAGSTAIIEDGGVYTGIPTLLITSGALPTTVAVVTFTMGGFTDTSLCQPW